MEKHVSGSERRPAVETALGYLNFSSGVPDPAFLASLNRLWADVAETPGSAWRIVCQQLRAALEGLPKDSPAFQDTAQAGAVLSLVQEQVLPGYWQFHRDLLFHQREDELCNAFFVGRVCEAVLRQGPPWEDIDRIREGAIAQLNDFVGYRPVAVLESKRVEPYPHERVRPVPLYVRGAGVAVGRYQPVVARALELLNSTDGDLLRSACFEPAALDELAFDPRAYDFDHPVNKRPNYHFGLWDLHHLDNQGRYRRFVVQQVTLDALMRRFADNDELPAEEILFEAAAVLAGTILMAAGVSGNGPETHDSTTTLATLLPRIAAYRDAFYERLIERMPEPHRKRLRAEAVERRQPFGGARQHLNAELARRRASQLEHVQLAKIFARMGYPEAAAEQADAVPVASARLVCQIECRLTQAHETLGSGQPEKAAELLAEIIELLHRGIHCGAIVDPWNILGFDAQFSLFPALENSVHDHRVDELVALVEQIFGVYERAWGEAAARDQEELCQHIREAFCRFTAWWRQFAAHEVSQIDAIDAQDAFQAAEHVARALNLWHKKGAASGHVGFWSPHAEMFDSPQAYALVIEALLDQSDFVAAMGLLVHWLSAADRIPLEQGDTSFNVLAERWLLQMRHRDVPADKPCPSQGGAVRRETWQQMCKFLDYLEANAGTCWHVPAWMLDASLSPHPSSRDVSDERRGEEDDEEEDAGDLFRAAYEDMTFHDSADDGIEGPIFDGGNATDDELVHEAERISSRLSFLATMSHLWRVAALAPLASEDATAELLEDRARAMQHWANQAQRNRRELMNLLDAVHQYRLPLPWGDHDSMLEYDRRRLVRESLLERIVITCVETANTDRLLRSAVGASRAAAQAPTESTERPGNAADSTEEEQLAVRLFAAMLRNETESVTELVAQWMAALSDKPLLYVPLAKGGEPRAIVDARVRQDCLQDLLKCLPRLGLLVETFRLVEAAREMERNNPVGPGAVTEFDEVFKVGWTALVECLVRSAKTWEKPKSEHGVVVAGPALVSCLKRLTEVLLVCWLQHSQTLRLSVLEKVNDRRAWNRLVEFIERYGADLFTQRFLSLGNLRAILHQGVDAWLRKIEEFNPEGLQFRLLADLDQAIPRKEAVERLTLVLEAIVENYSEYRDYNSTTTQSDRGELLYSLLDFLRLRANYDRICWNLRPIVVAHEILVRQGCKRAAQQWRRALRERIKAEADKYQGKLATLQKKYAMLMPTVTERINERFVRPLVIDRIRALVPCAVAEAQRTGAHPTFRLLQYETEFLMRQPSGVGFDVPAWLAAVEEEVQRSRLPAYQRNEIDDLCGAVAPIHLAYDEIRRQIDAWAVR